MNSDGAWRVVYLDGVGVWREENGQRSSFELPPGQGLVLARNAPAASWLTFSGEVGNDLSRQLTIVPGWNLIALSEGRELDIQQAFAHAGDGGPIGGTSEADADLLVLQDQAGVIHKLMFAQGLGAPYDGKWVDLSNGQVSTLILKPGESYYYYRQPTAGSMVVTY